MRIAVLAFLIAACSLPPDKYFGHVAAHPDPRRLTFCNSGEPESIDPAMGTSTTDTRIMSELFDGLTIYDPEGHPAPSLAERWDVSPDQTHLLFHLRAGARWSSGRALTSADLVYSWARLLHPLTASPRADNLWKVRNGQAYTRGRAALVLQAMNGLEAGDVVELLPWIDGKVPSPSLRVARRTLGLAVDPGGPVHATVPAGDQVTIVEVQGEWAWVHWLVGDGALGWVRLAELRGPNDDHLYLVRRLRRPFAAEQPAFYGALPGRALRMTPEVLGMRAPTPDSFEVELEAPGPFFLEQTLHPSLRPVPREVVARWPKTWFRPEHILTSGPFHLVGWRERDHFELVRSPTFWGVKDVRLEHLTILSMDDTSANASAYYTGMCDAVASNNMPASWLPVLAGETPGQNRRADYQREAYLGDYFFIVNLESVPSVHLRRALSLALDRRLLPLILKGGQIPSASLIPGQPIASLSDADLALCGVTRETPGLALIVVKDRYCYLPAPGLEYDPDAARRELALAKQELGPRFSSQLRFKFNTGVDYHKSIAEWAQHEWKATLGLDVSLESEEWKTYLKSTLQKQYQVARMGNIGNFPDPAEFLRQHTCKSPDNRTGFCDPAFEEAFAASEAEPDLGKRLALARKAEGLMLAQAPIIPLYVYTQHHLRKPYVKGLSLNLTDQLNFRTVWIDPDWKSRP